MMQIIGITIVGLLLGLMLKSINPAFSVIIAICTACLIFGKVVITLSGIINSINAIASGTDETKAYINIMLKTLGIALISQLIADVCRDSGESALAGQTEVVSKIVIIAMIMPLLEAVLKAVTGLLV